MHSTPGHAVQKAVFKGIFVAHAMHIGGKRDEELILPLNSSLSATLDQNQVNTSEWMVNYGRQGIRQLDHSSAVFKPGLCFMQRTQGYIDIHT